MYFYVWNIIIITQLNSLIQIKKDFHAPLDLFSSDVLKVAYCNQMIDGEQEKRHYFPTGVNLAAMILHLN